MQASLMSSPMDDAGFTLCGGAPYVILDNSVDIKGPKARACNK